jgi:hypothetical protein
MALFEKNYRSTRVADDKCRDADRSVGMRPFDSLWVIRWLSEATQLLNKEQKDESRTCGNATNADSSPGRPG